MNQIPCTIERLTEPDKLLIGTRWVEVGEEYKLQTETLYLAVSYIDRCGAKIFTIAPNIFTDNVSA